MKLNKLKYSFFIIAIITLFSLQSSSLFAFDCVSFFNSNEADLIYEILPLNPKTQQTEIKQLWTKLNNFLVPTKGKPVELETVFNNDKLKEWYDGQKEKIKKDQYKKISDTDYFRIYYTLIQLLNKLRDAEIPLDPNDFVIQWLRTQLSNPDKTELNELNKLIVNEYNNKGGSSVLVSLVSEGVLKSLQKSEDDLNSQIKGGHQYMNAFDALLVLRYKLEPLLKKEHLNDTDIDKLDNVYKPILDNIGLDQEYGIQSALKRIDIFTLFNRTIQKNYKIEDDIEYVEKKLEHFFNLLLSSQISDWSKLEHLNKWLKQVLTIKKEKSDFQSVENISNNNTTKNNQQYLNEIRLIKLYQLLLKRLKILSKNKKTYLIEKLNNLVEHENEKNLWNFKGELEDIGFILKSPGEVDDLIEQLQELKKLSEISETELIETIKQLTTKEDDTNDEVDDPEYQLQELTKSSGISEAKTIKQLDDTEIKNKLNKTGELQSLELQSLFAIMSLLGDEMFVFLKNSSEFSNYVEDTPALKNLSPEDGPIRYEFLKMFKDRYKNQANIMDGFTDQRKKSLELANTAASQMNSHQATLEADHAQEQLSLIPIMQAIINLGYIPVDLSGNEQAYLGYDIFYLGMSYNNEREIMNLLEIKGSRAEGYNTSISINEIRIHSTLINSNNHSHEFILITNLLPKQNDSNLEFKEMKAKRFILKDQNTLRNVIEDNSNKNNNSIDLFRTDSVTTQKTTEHVEFVLRIQTTTDDKENLPPLLKQIAIVLKDLNDQARSKNTVM